MEEQKQGILTLLKSAVTGETLSLPAGFDLSTAYGLIKAHRIAPLVYEGALNCGLSQEHPVMHLLFQSNCRAIQVNARQLQELARICSAFEAAGVDYLPLKGSIMKSMYPKPELRLMGDADILVHQEQYEQIVPIMKRLGYRWEKALDYENTWHHDVLHVELHSSLFSPQEKELYAYFGSGWKRAKVKEYTHYEMTPEDTFIYAVAHFAKHYRGTGIGCRYMVDLWVYLRCNPAMDEKYIQTELEKLGVWTFYQNIRCTLAWWFEDGSPNEKTELISEFVFDCGNWGNARTAVLFEETRFRKEERGTAWNRSIYVLRRLFPPKEKMHLYYPILNRLPWLLPAVWLYYLVKKMLFHKQSLRQHVHNMKMLTSENLKNRQQMLDEVGLGKSA